MPINPAIAMGVRGIELQDPLAQYGRFATIQNAQQQNALANMQLEEYGRARAEEEEIRNRLAGGASLESPETRNFLLGSKTGRGILKSQDEALSARYKAAGARFDAIKAQTELQRGFLAQIDPEDPNAVSKLMAFHQGNHTGPLGEFLAQVGVKPDQGSAEIAALQGQPPEAIRAFINRSAQGVEAFNSKLMEVSPGATLIDPRTRQPVFTAPVAPRESKLLTPEEEAQRVRVALASRPPAQPRPEPAPRTQQVTMSDGTLGIMNMDTGQVTPASLGGAPVRGKPSAFAEKTAVQRKQLGLDLDRAITELTDATKKGGLIDQSTGSGAGRLVDVSAGFFGQATPGAIAAGKLAPISDLVLKMVPRFEGPQSDKDTRSYKEAAGQLADSSLPNAIRKQAGLEILRLMKARRDQFVSSEMAVEGATPGAVPAATRSGATVSNW